MDMATTERPVFVAMDVAEASFVLAGLTHLKGSTVEKLRERIALKIANATSPANIEIEDAYIQAAREGYHDEGDLELDDKPVVSRAEGESGAYVMMWKWITAAEADLCDECSASLDDGEGYNGLCGSCADKAEEEAE